MFNTNLCNCFELMTTKMKTVLFITFHQVAPNPIDFYLSLEHKLRYFFKLSIFEI